jgi:hypothetical protein
MLGRQQSDREIPSDSVREENETLRTRTTAKTRPLDLLQPGIFTAAASLVDCALAKAVFTFEPQAFFNASSRSKQLPNVP